MKGLLYKRRQFSSVVNRGWINYYHCTSVANLDYNRCNTTAILNNYRCAATANFIITAVLLQLTLMLTAVL